LFEDHFSSKAGEYTAFRPRYPAELGARLAASFPPQCLVWEAGCGSGQFTTLLAEHVGHVFATDPSEALIARAPAHRRVIYSVARAEASGLEPGSVDVVVAAQAAHWFDIEAFYGEARRVSGDGGSLALITYGIPIMEGEVGRALDRFYGKLQAFWPPERRHVEEGYANLAFPFERHVFEAPALEERWSRTELLGYLGTWSALRRAPEGGWTLLADFSRGLESVWPDSAKPRPIKWPLTVILGSLGPGP
jgi:SAM-dependent methyltransferase